MPFRASPSRSIALAIAALWLVATSQKMESSPAGDLKAPCGPVMNSPLIVPYYYGNWAEDDIAAHQKYLEGLAKYLSGENVPEGSQSVLLQYGVTSADVADEVTNPEVSQPIALDVPGALAVIHEAQQARALLPYDPNRLILLLLPHGATLAGDCSLHGAEAAGKYYAIVTQDCAPWLQATARVVFQAAMNPAISIHPGWDEAVDQCGATVRLPFGPVPSVWDRSAHACSTSGFDKTQAWGASLAVATMADQGLQLWAVDPAGAMWSTKRGPEAESEWTDWSKVAGAPKATQVAAAALPDGRVQVWAIESQKSELWSSTQSSADVGASWERWKKFPNTAFPVAYVAAAALPDGRLQVWAVDSQNRLWTTSMAGRTAKDPWAPWNMYGDAPDVVQVAVAPLTDGRLQVWALDPQNKLWTIWMTGKGPEAQWTNWAPFPNTPPVKRIAAGVLVDRRIQLLATDSKDRLLTTWKLAADPNAGWNSWSFFPGAQNPQAQWVATGTLADGRMQVWFADLHSRLFTTCKCTAQPRAYWNAVSQFAPRRNP